MTSTAGPFVQHLTTRIGSSAAAPPDLLERVNAALGPDGCATVLAPDSADGVAAVLASCSAEGWPVIPIGAGTWLDPRGHTPGTIRRGTDAGRAPVLLSTMRLNRVTEHEPADLVIGVQGGVTLEQLGAALAAKRQWLPLDPAANPHATIGAVIANASAGPLRAGHGTPRDMVLGIEIATGDGRLLRFGGRVVKNVAGYDGVRLMVGSRGSLGVITAVYLRVRGGPHADRTLAIPCGEADGRDGAVLALALRDAVACDAIELVSPGVALGLGLDHPGWHLLVRLLGSEAAVNEGLERIRRVVDHAVQPGPHPDRVAIYAPSAVWAALARIEAGASTALRLTGPATGLADAVGALFPASAIGAEAAGWRMAAHAADGVIRLWRAGGPVGSDPDSLPGWGAIASSGYWTVRYDRPSGGAAGLPDRQRPGREAVRNLAGRLRSVFDPAGIMSVSAEV